MDMEWRQRRTITFLSAVLGVLVVLVLVAAGFRYRQARQAAGEKDAAIQTGIPTAAESYTALEYDNGSTHLSFAYDETQGAWKWADDPSFPLDARTVTGILSLLGDLHPQQTLPSDGTAESYGFDQPNGTLTATAADGTVLSLTLGKATTDGTSYYMQLGSDESTVYIIADTLYRQMSTPIYQMMELPALPALSAVRLDSVTVKGAVSTTLTSNGAKKAENLTWRADGADVTGRSGTVGLLEELCSLELASCVDYRPSHQALSICGFDAPAVQVSIQYRAETGREQTFSFSVGTADLSGTGYYVQLEGDGPIYAMDAGRVDTLLAVAANGLSA